MCLRNLIFSIKIVWSFLKMCLWSVNISPEIVSELFSKFVCKMSKFLLKIVSFTICVWKMTMFLLKNCLNCFQTLSAKCFPESVSDHYQNLSAKLQYFSSKLVWIVFKICLRNNWQRWFNISNWNSGQICFYSTNKWSTPPSAARNVKLLKAAFLRLCSKIIFLSMLHILEIPM